MSWTTSISKTGAYERKPSGFRDFIKPNSQFPPASGRYHLFVSLACPWAHRTLIVRALKGLEQCISVTVVDYFLDKSTGWAFTDKKPKCTTFKDFTTLRQIYHLMDKDYSSNITVPVLFDLETNKIVNNESSEIIRMLTSEFNEFSSNPKLDLYPVELRSKIDAINEPIYNKVLYNIHHSINRSMHPFYECSNSRFFLSCL